MMKTKSNMTMTLLLVALLHLGTHCQAFVIAPSSVYSFSQATMTTTTSTALSMSQIPLDDDDNDDTLAPTERLLLQAARHRNQNDKKEMDQIQRYGETVKGDGWDGLRAVVWQVFFASDFVFGALAVGLMAGLLLNLLGYGYYFDSSNSALLPFSLHIDTLDHIRQEQAIMAAQQQYNAMSQQAAMDAATTTTTTIHP